MGIFSGLMKKKSNVSTDTSVMPDRSSASNTPASHGNLYPSSMADHEVVPDPQALKELSEKFRPQYEVAQKKKARRQFLNTVLSEIVKNLAAPLVAIASIPTKKMKWVPFGQRGQTDINMWPGLGSQNGTQPIPMPDAESESSPFSNQSRSPYKN